MSKTEFPSNLPSFAESSSAVGTMGVETANIVLVVIIVIVFFMVSITWDTLFSCFVVEFTEKIGFDLYSTVTKCLLPPTKERL